MQLPNKFIDRSRSLLSEQWDIFVNSLSLNAPTSIRFNSSKWNKNTTVLSQVPWCRNGFYLNMRPSFTFDPLFHVGAYYVQEASSMFVEQVFRQYIKDDVKVLDLCAAPGGKSSHILSLISKDSLLVSNEVIRQRANILSENLTKTGYCNSIVTNSDPVSFEKLRGFFDLVLVDVPCSGEGMFRKDHEALSEWSESNVKLCSERQRRIVADVWDSLKPGGFLIYSTCTYNVEENEENVLWIQDTLGAHILPIAIETDWHIEGSKLKGKDIPVYRFFPHKTKGEGFFLALLQKEESADNDDSKLNRQHKKAVKDKKANLSDEYRNYLLNPLQFVFFSKNDSWFAFPEKLYSYFEELVSALKLVSAGIYVGETKGKDFIPQHSLAMSTEINRGAFVLHEVDKETAIAYLRKEALVFDNLNRGYVLLTYKNIPLGFIKNIGSRANNLYPNEWRIRSSHVPIDLKDITETI